MPYVYVPRTVARQASLKDGVITSVTFRPRLRWLPPRQSALIYHLAMTGSNLVAAACVGVWVVHAQAHVSTRAFAAAAIIVLICLRQKESNQLCRVSRCPCLYCTLALPYAFKPYQPWSRSYAPATAPYAYHLVRRWHWLGQAGPSD